MADKPESTRARYCGEVVGGTYCNAKLERSSRKVNSHYEGVCPQCGRYYLSYTSCSSEPKASLPRASQITASKNRACTVEAEVKRLSEANYKGTPEELKALAQKNIAYEAKKAKEATTKAATKKTLPKKAATKKTLPKKAATKKTTTKKAATKQEVLSAEQETVTVCDDITEAIAGLDIPFDAPDALYTPFSTVVDKVLGVDTTTQSEGILDGQDSIQPEVVKWDELPKDVKFFTGSWQKSLTEAEEFPDILEEVDCETIVLKQPAPLNPGVSDELIDSMWTDAFASKHNLTATQVKEFLSAESALLRLEQFQLDGIDFNPNKLPEEVILEEIRDKSLNTLMMCGKTSTQDAVDEARAAKAKGETARQKAKEDYIIKSRSASQGLAYNFLSGVMTDEQTAEFMNYGLISKANLKNEPPSPEHLYTILNRKRILSSMGKPTTKEIELDVISDYNDVWKGICADICNKEFGGHSYWLAAGMDWHIQEYANDVIKTAFASGLSVVPMATLGELKSMYEKAHEYLNDMEFLAHSPRAMRDSLERFTLFNAAYSAVYEGVTPIFKPKAIENPRYTWEAYMQSDVVILQLPKTGLVTGGLAMLDELLTSRAIARKSTILVSTISMARLIELNAGLVPALFGQNGIAIVSSKDVGPKTYLSPSTYVYHTIHEDRAIKGSAVQKKTRRIESRNKA